MPNEMRSNKRLTKQILIFQKKNEWRTEYCKQTSNANHYCPTYKLSDIKNINAVI